MSRITPDEVDADLGPAAMSHALDQTFHPDRDEQYVISGGSAGLVLPDIVDRL
jgi:hypothetical protein